MNLLDIIESNKKAPKQTKEKTMTKKTTVKETTTKNTLSKIQELEKQIKETQKELDNLNKIKCSADRFSAWVGLVDKYSSLRLQKVKILYGIN